MVMRRHHGPAQHQPEQAVAGLQCGGVVFLLYSEDLMRGRPCWEACTRYSRTKVP